EVVLEVAGRDQRSRVRGEEAAGLLLQGGVDPGQRGGIALRLVRENDIEQKRRNSGIGEVGGDARPHGSGAQDGNTAEWCHWLSPWSLSERMRASGTALVLRELLASVAYFVPPLRDRKISPIALTSELILSRSCWSAALVSFRKSSVAARDSSARREIASLVSAILSVRSFTRTDSSLICRCVSRQIWRFSSRSLRRSSASPVTCSLLSSLSSIVIFCSRAPRLDYISGTGPGRCEK